MSSPQQDSRVDACGSWNIQAQTVSIQSPQTHGNHSEHRSDRIRGASSTSILSEVLSRPGREQIQCKLGSFRHEDSSLHTVPRSCFSQIPMRDSRRSSGSGDNGSGAACIFRTRACSYPQEFWEDTFSMRAIRSGSMGFAYQGKSIFPYTQSRNDKVLILIECLHKVCKSSTGEMLT